MTRKSEGALSVRITDPLWFPVRKDHGAFTMLEYSHEISAIGGFDTAEIVIVQNESEVESWIESGLGRHIQVFDNLLQTAWEGFVDEVSITMGSLTLTIGPMLDIANRVLVEYTPIFYSQDGEAVTGTQTETPIADDADSQARYAILEKIISGGQLWDDGVVNDAIILRDMYLNEFRSPDVNHEISVAESSYPVVALACKGYYHFLDNYVYNAADTGLISLPNKLKAILAADPNNIISTDYKHIDTSTSLLLIIPSLEDQNRMAASIINEILEYGDANDKRTLFAMYENREAYFYTTPDEVKYVQYIKSSSNQIELRTGGQIYPWAVRAGQWLRIADVIVGKTVFSDIRTDTRNLFIETVKYTMPNELELQGTKVRKTKHLQAKLSAGGW